MAEQQQIKNHYLLTPQEKAFAADAAAMLTKNRIIEEVYSLFGRLAEKYQLLTGSLPAEIVRLHPKISKGENYLGLPWVMLDYPRYFTGKNAFTVRTMFWWGHYFSQHLLLQGDKMPLLDLRNKVAGWHFSTGSNPWRHQFDATTSVPAEKVTNADLTLQQPNGFYKISSYLPLQEWDRAEAFLATKFEEAIRMVIEGNISEDE